MRTRKPQATEQIATVQLEKLLDISARSGNAAPVAQPVEHDEVEIIRDAPPKKFAESSAVGKPALAVPVPVYEEEEDLAIPIETSEPESAVVAAPVVEERTPSRRLWWLTLIAALIASGVIAARMYGL